MTIHCPGCGAPIEDHADWKRHVEQGAHDDDGDTDDD